MYSCCLKVFITLILLHNLSVYRYKALVYRYKVLVILQGRKVTDNCVISFEIHPS